MAALEGGIRDDGGSRHTIGVLDKLAAAAASRRDEDAGDKKVVAPSAWKTTAPGWAAMDASRLGEGGKVKAVGEAWDVSVAPLAGRLA